MLRDAVSRAAAEERAEGGRALSGWLTRRGAPVVEGTGAEVLPRVA